jgi:hypothetical protein
LGRSSSSLSAALCQVSPQEEGLQKAAALRVSQWMGSLVSDT